MSNFLVLDIPCFAQHCNLRFQTMYSNKSSCGVYLTYVQGTCSSARDHHAVCTLTEHVGDHTCQTRSAQKLSLAFKSITYQLNISLFIQHFSKQYIYPTRPRLLCEVSFLRISQNDRVAPALARTEALTADAARSVYLYGTLVIVPARAVLAPPPRSLPRAVT
jgi:hypothetical protein